MDLVPLEEITRMLKRKRQRLGVKQKKAASVAGLSPSHVNRIENNTTNPSYTSLYQLWEALDTLEKREVEHAGDIMNSPVASVSPEDTLEKVSRIMRENNFSQLPVIKDGDSIGRITESAIIESGDPDAPTREVMGPALLEVQEQTPVSATREILKDEPAVLVTSGNGIEGIITKADLI